MGLSCGGGEETKYMYLREVEFLFYVYPSSPKERSVCNVDFFLKLRLFTQDLSWSLIVFDDENDTLFSRARTLHM